MRFRPGDFFAAHADGDRGLAVLVYFTAPDWRPGDGGEFVFQAADGSISRFPPRFNSALVFPYRTRTTHWVAPVSPQGGLRYTIAVDYADGRRPSVMGRAESALRRERIRTTASRPGYEKRRRAEGGLLVVRLGWRRLPLDTMHLRVDPTEVRPAERDALRAM